MSTAILSSARDSAAVLLIALLDADGARHLLAPLAATLAGSRDAGQVEKVLGLLAKVSEASQVECLKGFVAGLPHDAKLADQSPDGWQSVKKLLVGSTPAVRMLVIQLGARLQLTDSPEFQAAFATAAKQALDAKSPLDIRERNIELLASAAYTSLAPTVSMLLDARQPPALQLAAIRALAASEDDRVGRALVERWKGLTPQLRSEALQTLFSRENRLSALLDALENGEIQTGEINALRREQLIKSQSEALASRAKKLFENPTANAQLLQRIKVYQQALAGQHDTKKGGEVFAKHCLNCHKIKDQGHQVGPELGSVINKPDEAILLDLLDPSSHVESEFGSYIVVTQDGNTFTGLLASDSATSVTLKKEKGESETILRKDIELMQASELSLMPSNFHELITSQETADLIAYLREMFGKAPPTPPIAAEK